MTTPGLRREHHHGRGARARGAVGHDRRGRLGGRAVRPGDELGRCARGPRRHRLRVAPGRGAADPAPRRRARGRNRLLGALGRCPLGLPTAGAAGLQPLPHVRGGGAPARRGRARRRGRRRAAPPGARRRHHAARRRARPAGAARQRGPPAHPIGDDRCRAGRDAARAAQRPGRDRPDPPVAPPLLAGGYFAATRSYGTVGDSPAELLTDLSNERVRPTASCRRSWRVCYQDPRMRPARRRRSSRRRAPPGFAGRGTPSVPAARRRSSPQWFRAAACSSAPSAARESRSGCDASAMCSPTRPSAASPLVRRGCCGSRGCVEPTLSRAAREPQRARGLLRVAAYGAPHAGGVAMRRGCVGPAGSRAGRDRGQPAL